MMKRVTRHGACALVIVGAVAASAACSSGSSGNGPGTGSSSGGGSGSGGTGTLPTIAITSPMAGSVMVTPSASGEDDIPVAFTLTNFTLKPPGGCGSVSDTCGHIHVVIDSAMSCGGPPYNNDDETGSPATAIVSKCSTINGAHTISLELHADDHSPVNDANGMVISSSVQVTVQGG
jgi:hypothetical protein